MSQAIVTTIEKLIPELSLEEQLLVFERLAQQLRYTIQQSNKPQDLYGIWRDFVPEDFDLDQALQDIRQGWQHEWGQI
jgi:hypothetical protein